MRRSANVATPFTIVAWLLPDSVASAGEPGPSSRCTSPAGTGVPDASYTVTRTAGEITAFAATRSGGWLVKVRNAGDWLWSTTGDQLGSLSAPVVVNRVCADPSAFIT